MMATGGNGRRRVLSLLGGVVLSLSLALVWTSFQPASAQSGKKVRKVRRHIKKRVKRQIGAPYSYGGMSPGGFDCSGLTKWTFKRHTSLPHSTTSQFELAGERNAKRVWRRGKLRKGDLVFFDTTSSRVGHAGVYIGHGGFVSATSSSGVRKDSVWDPYYWGPRYVGATRLGVTRYGS